MFDLTFINSKYLHLFWYIKIMYYLCYVRYEKHKRCKSAHKVNGFRSYHKSGSIHIYTEVQTEQKHKRGLCMAAHPSRQAMRYESSLN